MKSLFVKHIWAMATFGATFLIFSDFLYESLKNSLKWNIKPKDNIKTIQEVLIGYQCVDYAKSPYTCFFYLAFLIDSL